jgi:hypothetical protein
MDDYKLTISEEVYAGPSLFELEARESIEVSFMADLLQVSRALKSEKMRCTVAPSLQRPAAEREKKKERLYELPQTQCNMLARRAGRTNLQYGEGDPIKRLQADGCTRHTLEMDRGTLLPGTRAHARPSLFSPIFFY